MTLATMADRSLPLAERVQAALSLVLYDGVEDVGDYALAKAALVADVAAADRLARACLPYEPDDDPADDQKAYEDDCAEWIAALDAYRVRMGVGNV